MKKLLKFRKSKTGFTLVELVIVIAIVIILSVISVPIYRGYVDKAKKSEGYALLGAILSAQKAYYSEYGYFYYSPHCRDVEWSNYYPALGVDARSNKYFTLFYSFAPANIAKNEFCAFVQKPEDLCEGNVTRIGLSFGVDPGWLIIKDISSTGSWSN